MYYKIVAFPFPHTATYHYHISYIVRGALVFSMSGLRPQATDRNTAPTHHDSSVVRTAYI